jgi:hypothetical protein
MANKDFSKVKNATEDNNPFLKINKENKQKAQVNKKEKLVEIDGVKYIIKRWSNTEVFQRLPTIANLLFVPTMAPMSEGTYEADGNTEFLPELVDKGQIMFLLYSRMQDLNLDDWMKDTIGKVYKEGSTTPVNFDEDFENPLTIVEVVSEVLQANFMIQLCSDLLNLTPQLLEAMILKVNMEPSDTI